MSAPVVLIQYLLLYFFFFKQKTAYDMLISDWSSDVCSSDLHGWLDNANSFIPLAERLPNPLLALDFSGHGHSDHAPAELATHLIDHVRSEIGRAWSRESV